MLPPRQIAGQVVDILLDGLSGRVPDVMPALNQWPSVGLAD